MKYSASNKIWDQSKAIFPGGVNSPVRAYGSVNGNPIALASGKGCTVFDEDKNNYLDFLNSLGPLILGHSHPQITKALKKQLKKGTSFGTVTKQERDMGNYILKNLSYLERIRFMSSGTEAVMAAVRLARGYTKRSKIIKFEGCYHGHFDSVLVSAGSGLLTFSGNISEASSPGVPANAIAETIVLPLDNEELVEKAFHAFKDEIAAVLIEPLPANSGLLPQRAEYLQFLKKITKEHGALLIFDEVISGFRLSFGGYTGKYGVEADLYTYGKVIGGGLPVGALAGKTEIMNHLSPVGKVYQAGTLSGNPMAMTAGLTALKILNEEKVYDKLNKLSKALKKSFQKEIEPLFKGKSFSIRLEQDESIFWLSIQDQETPKTIRKINEVWEKSAQIYKCLFWQMRDNGFHMAPSSYEVGFLSAPMKEKDMQRFVKQLKQAIKELPPYHE